MSSSDNKKSGRKPRLKAVLIIVIALIIFVGANEALNYALIPYDSSRVTMHNLVVGDYKQLIVGSSHSKCGMDPDVLYEETGLKTFNASRGGEYPEDILYIVKAAARKHKLKRVIYEVDPAYWEVIPNQTSEFTAFYLYMPWSIVRIEYLWYKLMSVDYRDTLTPWYFYRNQLKKVPENLKMKASKAYKNYEVVDEFSNDGQTYRENGMLAINHLPSHKQVEDVPILWEGDGVRSKSVTAARKLVDFCKDKEIELVFVMMPIPDVTYLKYRVNYDAASEYMTSFCDEEGVKLLNYYGVGVSKQEDVPHSLEDFMDYDGHLYKESAVWFSRTLGKILK